MEFVLVALILAAVFAFIAYPILNPRQEEKNAPEPNALDGLVAQRDSTYQAIRDLDFDYQLGKLSTNDYDTLRERYKAHAASVLQEIDATSNTSAQPIAPASMKGLRCGNCGTPYQAGDQFCRRCGNKL